MDALPDPRLPKRPISHELEELSIAALRSATPRDRVQLRQRDGFEYGVDVDAELFAEGYTTGDEFMIQMKSTQRLADTRKPFVDGIKMTTLNYWRSLGRPVLIALWEADTNVIWFQWSHEIDTYDFEPNQKTFRIKFDPDRVLTQETWTQIEAEVAAHRVVRFARQNLPLRLTVTATGSLGSASAGTVRLHLERLMRTYPEVAAKTSSGQPEFRVQIHQNTVTIGTAALPSTVIHYTNEPEEVAPTEINYAADIAIGIALQLSRLNLADHAAKIISDHWRSASLLDSDFLGTCVALLLNAGEVDEAIQMASAAYGDPDTENYVLLPALSTAVKSPTDRAQIATQLSAWAESQESEGRTKDAAVSLVNAARAVSHIDIDLSLRLYEQAAGLDESYRQRGYWWEELAGLLFNQGNFEESAKAYREAIDLGHLDAMDLYGDALLFSGRYRDAIQPLRSGTTNPIRRTEFRLKAKCFEHLLSVVSIECQNRDQDAAESAWDYFDPSMEKCMRTLRIDLLHAPALSWLAHELGHGLDLRIAICAAFAAPGLPFLWLTCLSACSLEDRDLYTEALIAARQYCGDGLVDFLLDSGEESLAADLDCQLSALPPEEPRELTIYSTRPDGSTVRHRRN